MYLIPPVLIGTALATRKRRVRTTSSDPAENSVFGSLMFILPMQVFILVHHFGDIERTGQALAVLPEYRNAAGIIAALSVVLSFFLSIVIVEQRREWVKDLAILLPWATLAAIFITWRFSLFGIW